MNDLAHSSLLLTRNLLKWPRPCIVYPTEVPMRLLQFFLPLVFLSAGCTSVEFVRKDLSPQKQGILRFTPASTSAGEAKVRDKVHNKASDFCGGPFEITKEYQAREAT